MRPSEALWRQSCQKLETALDPQERAEFLSGIDVNNLEAFQASLDNLCKTYSRLNISVLVKDKLDPHLQHLESFEKAISLSAQIQTPKAGTLLIHITEQDGTLFMNFQDNPQETYKMIHCQGDIFTWLSSRNDLASRGRFIRFGAWFYTMTFAADTDGKIVSVNWQHDEAKKEGEDFWKR
ncbi:hypothetical protein DL98DRAFT_595734 [Cadophora sp. DSE1049]|nr:hypothetical protein DL98DRAFT_595734 [Cadophora sp. DSE1049]